VLAALALGFLPAMLIGRASVRLQEAVPPLRAAASAP